jgi:hypothetical protein
MWAKEERWFHGAQFSVGAIKWLVEETKSLNFHSWVIRRIFFRIWGSNSGDYEQFYLLGYNALQSVEGQPLFRCSISPPSSNQRISQAKKRCLLCLPLAFTSVSCLSYSSIMKMEATCSSETPVDFQSNTRQHVPEDRTFLKKLSRRSCKAQLKTSNALK